ncbi:glycosyl transferase [filamentous cyanobacterium CCP1]|nr:glycosyl transferase [filamentous cyanobacterium CCP2]PSB65900.1 glycosyl transferase [filamentous cyanobacterium CCP1]
MSRVGLVAIGRNEGERLRQCLTSALAQQVAQVVYVDSGSTDNSVKMARSLGVEVVELDLSTPFTAARARNAGFARLVELNSALEFVQFVDGDCELVTGWIDRAQQELDTYPEVAVVCGRRRERYPEQSIYNRLCDIEWDTPIGEAKACGGDAMMRVAVVQQVGGFNPTLIAGEEPELCVRIRQQGWKVRRVDAEMTLHDAQMFRFSQWWKRVLRAGHAYAEGAYLHGGSPERHWVKESRSIWLWGLFLPLGAIGLSGITHGWSLLLLAAYLLTTYRIYQYGSHRGWKAQDASLYALSCVIGKFPNALGQIKFYWNRWLGKTNQLIEYK